MTDGHIVCRILGKSIKRLRLKYKWSQEILAEKVDISANFLSNIENGKTWVSPQTLAGFANAFNIEPYELFLPARELPATYSCLIKRYAEETKAMITVSLDEITRRFTNS
ncbi:MAG: helix-turn-helix domain-containing protein [Spirochaetaceae bacterium]|jgi:transcriptional regulator with XRE-family HTH domain|nr:helix-turn-helix domain-containing protein [Spirochaetaceae bacterium]